MKTLFVVLMICLSGQVSGDVIDSETLDVFPADTVTTWAFRPSYVLERVVIDTVVKCDTVFVPESVMGTLDDSESVTYCRVEIRCKKASRERVLWSVVVDEHIDISGLSGLRVRKVPNHWLGVVPSVAADSLQVRAVE